MKPVRGELKPHILDQPLLQVKQEGVCRFLGSLAHDERGDQFGILIHRHEHPLIPKFLGVIVPYPFGFLLHKAPNLVGLQVLGADVVNVGVEQSGAVPASFDQQTADCVPVNAGHALG